MAERPCRRRAARSAPVLLLAIGLVSALATAAPAEAASTIVVINLDGPGEGLNDPSPVEPVGGNAATTLGAARLAAVRFAASMWAEALASPIPIEIGVSFDPLGGTSSAAVLGLGGPDEVYRDFVGAPVTGTWYPSALADKLSSYDLAEGSALDQTVVFNSDVDGDQVLGTSHFYYGFDDQTPEGDASLVEVALHELAHGLGFTTFVDRSTGAKLFDHDDVFLLHLERHGAIPPDFPSMSNAERLAAVAAAPEVHWTGDEAIAAAASGLVGGVGADGHVEMHAPSPVSSDALNHFAATLSPDELLEPFYTDSMLPDPTLTAAVLADLGWGSSETCQTGVPLGPGEPPEVVIAEAGVVSFKTGTRADWQVVTLSHTFDNPVVIAQPPTYFGPQAAAIRLRSVGPGGFEMQIAEWDYLDGSHSGETVSYLVVEAGSWQLEDGARLIAGGVTVSGDSFVPVTFGEPFAAPPVVLSQVQTDDDPAAVVTRQLLATISGFSVRLQEEQAAPGKHGPETVGWVAIETGFGSPSPLVWRAGLTPDEVTDAWYTIGYINPFEFIGPLIFLANLQSFDDDDPAALRYRFVDDTLDVLIQEEQSADGETVHDAETVGYLALNPPGEIRGTPLAAK